MKIRKPLLEALNHYEREKIYPCHTPGHKGGRGFAAELKSCLGSTAAAMDVSLMSELDDLHCPSGCLKEAQEMTAALYGSDRCFFAVNGTTGAIHAMLLGALKPNDRLLVPRNSHRAVAGALVLGGLEAVFLEPGYDRNFGIATQPSLQDIEEALACDPEIKAVLLTTPNYYGLTADVAAIADLVHRRGAFLLVDEAHGAHLGFSSFLPPSALQQGADACAQSTHKTLGALTQCSWLHIRTERLDAEKMASAVCLLTSTSPNYLLLSSLDAARSQLEAAGSSMVEAAARVALELRRKLQSVTGLELLDEKVLARGEVAGYDCTKVTVKVSGLGVTGMEAADLLRQAGIAVELADFNNVLFLLTYADDNPEIEAIMNKIEKVFRTIAAMKLPPLGQPAAIRMPFPAAVMTAREAFWAETENVKLAEAAGRIAAEQVSFYPPGIPVILPGERLTGEVLAYCRALLNLRIPVSGPVDGTLKRIRVIKL